MVDFNFGSSEPAQNNGVWDPTKSSFTDWNSNNNSLQWDANTSPESFLAFGNQSQGSLSALNSGPSFWEGFAGNKNTPGYGGMVLGGALGLGQLFQGFEGLKLAKDSLKASKSQFRESTDIQKQQINTDLQERGEAKFLGRGGTGETAEEYYNKNKFV